MPVIFLFLILLANALYPVTAQAQNLVIEPEACQMLVKHTPAPDVAYTPGVDVDGNAVAPADLPNSNAIQMPKQINIPLTLNLAKQLGITMPAGVKPEATIGVVSVDNGAVSFNGQPLTDKEQDNLAVMCLSH